ncbi:hypothetical protein ACSBOB_14945 [Mesorhizobium sp. ASY16-5R]|uniref:hypothetical protein n=1 Tax=Mesorhizobium sp. ASY16-5R TaxID=3445772 RepID=UPI003FA07A68
MAGDDVLHLDAGFLLTDVRIGDKITYDGGVVYATRYSNHTEKKVSITPAPASAPASAVFKLERMSRNIQFDNCEIVGGRYGLDISGSEGVQIHGGMIRDCGQYGALVHTGAIVDIDGTTFSNSGVMRVKLSPSAATRDVVVGAQGTLRADKLIFKDGQRVNYNLLVDVDAIGGYLRDSIFVPLDPDSIGKPLTAHASISSDTFQFSGNRDAKGRSVLQSGTWVPDLRIGGVGTGITYGARLGTYMVWEDSVSIDWDITLTSKGSNTGPVSVAGLPFDQDEDTANTVGMTVLSATSGLTGTPLCRVANTVIEYDQSSATGAVSLTNAALTNTTRFRGSAVYRREP